jgi:hypothetical protein
VETPTYEMESYSTGIYGHVEYVVYSDGSQDIKVYPNLSHRNSQSELYQDLNGDGSVDRIRLQGSELKFNRLNDILVRDSDYSTHTEQFDEADQMLQELMEKYQAPSQP